MLCVIIVDNNYQNFVQQVFTAQAAALGDQLTAALTAGLASYRDEHKVEVSAQQAKVADDFIDMVVNLTAAGVTALRQAVMREFREFFEWNAPSMEWLDVLAQLFCVVPWDAKVAGLLKGSQDAKKMVMVGKWTQAFLAQYMPFVPPEYDESTSAGAGTRRCTRR